MKRIIKVVSLILGLIACLFSFTGCSKFRKEHKFLYEQMSAINVELEGYELINTRDSASDYIRSKDGEYVLNDKPIEIRYISDGNAFFEVIYNDTVITINSDFMADKSAAYVEMSHIWNKEESAKIGIGAVFCFDERLFILTSGLFSRFGASVKGEIPITLFCYDIEGDSLLYAGFYSGELDSKGYYAGFLGHTLFLTIIKNN